MLTKILGLCLAVSLGTILGCGSSNSSPSAGGLDVAADATADAPTAAQCCENKCGGICVSLQSDFENCGSCNFSCSAIHGTTLCASGICQNYFPYQYMNCSPELNVIALADTQNDPRNCGGCGNICLGEKPVCIKGQCAAKPATCPAS